MGRFRQATSAIFATACCIALIAFGTEIHAADWSDSGEVSIVVPSLLQTAEPPGDLLFDQEPPDVQSVLVQDEPGTAPAPTTDWAEAEASDLGSRRVASTPRNRGRQRALFKNLFDGPDTCWMVRGESIIMWRNAPDSRPLFSTVPAGTSTIGATALDSNQLESDVLAAPRLTVMRSDPCGYAVEGVYLWAGNFYSQRSLPFVTDGYATSPPGIYGNQWGPSPNPLDDTSLSSASAKLIGNLQSVEINGRTPIMWGAVKWLGGFRWLQWNESMTIEDSFVDPATSPPTIGQDIYATQCFNNLYGGQIGLDTMFWNNGRGMRVEGVVKAGAYANVASQNSVFQYGSGGTPFFTNSVTATTNPTKGAFVGEVGLTAVFPITRHSEFRVGYAGLWLEGLAQPSNQLSGQRLTALPPAAGSISTAGGLVLQGLSFGLQKQW